MTARELAVKTLVELERRKAFSNLLLDKALSNANLSGPDSGFVTALVMGVTERRLTLDYFLVLYCGNQLGHFAPELTAILRMGFYQLLYMKTPPHAAIFESVELAKNFAPKATGLVNAVLRRFMREGGKQLLDNLKGAPYEVLSIRHSINPELVRLFMERYGQERGMAILAGFDCPHKAFIAVNTRKITPSALADKLNELGVESGPAEREGMLCISGLALALKSPLFAEGLFFVQGLSSRLTAEFAASAGKVLDVCAAPGGKSFSMALLAPDADIMALELHENRVALMQKEADRMGLAMTIRQNDASVYDEKLSGADVVLCDLPCSGFGVLHKKPELRYRTLGEIANLPGRQKEILATSARYLKTGGRLIYSTCTLNPAENEEVVAAFLAAHPDFEPLALPYIGRANFIYNGLGSRLTILPDSDYDGFFIAGLRKKPQA